jgi:hypothetical protein
MCTHDKQRLKLFFSFSAARRRPFTFVFLLSPIFFLLFPSLTSHIGKCQEVINARGASIIKQEDKKKERGSRTFLELIIFIVPLS